MGPQIPRKQPAILDDSPEVICFNKMVGFLLCLLPKGGTTA